jgi:polyvinyl alcohol dehydrogenase (cytochrome)
MSFRAVRGRRAIVLVGLLVAVVPAVAFGASGSDWLSGGGNVSDTHSSDSNQPNVKSVPTLGVKWWADPHSALTGGLVGDVTATPVVTGGAVYYPDWEGYLNKVDARTGATIWSKPISGYTGVAGDVSRASPAVAGNTVYLGDAGSVTRNDLTSPLSAVLLAVDASTGALDWATTLDSHPWASVTGGALVYNGVVYQGVSSQEEAASVDPGYPCCTFRGSVVAVSASTGQILWKTYTVPDNGGSTGGYSGGAIWSTTPAIDPATNTLYVTTGNNYTVPAAANSCENAGGAPGSCLSPDDHIDSILALDAATGAIKWATGVGGFDTFNEGNCPTPPDPTICPDDPGADYDFGTGPNLFTVNGKLVVGAGQKSGQYWALDAATGRILWETTVGPGSFNGGIEFGAATDGQRIYVTENNAFRIPYTLPDGTTTTLASVAALDPATGRILWQTPDPGGLPRRLYGPISVANGVVYVPSVKGDMYAFDAATGQLAWVYHSPRSVDSGPAVVNGVVYWGDGFGHGTGAEQGGLYAFSLGYGRA